MSFPKRPKERYFYSCVSNIGIDFKVKLATSPFMLKVKPYPDELFSSYMTRVAIKHLYDPVSFTNLYFPEQKNIFFSTDRDVSIDKDMIIMVNQKSFVPKERILDTTIKSYEGILWEKIYPHTRNHFVLNMMMRCRKANKKGLRYCPECLKEKDYFRKEWRLSFSTVCTKHKCYLLDECPHCKTPLTIYKRKHDIQEFNCYSCGFVFKKAKTPPVPKNSKAIQNLKYLYKIMNNGWVMMDNKPIHSLAYFPILAQITKIIFNQKKTNYPLLKKEMQLLGIEDINKTRKKAPLQEAGWKIQLVVYTAAIEILKKRKNLERFIELNNIKTNTLHKDIDHIPFWYVSIIEQYRVFKPAPCDAEILNAIEYMKKHRLPLTRAQLSKLVGAHLGVKRHGHLFGDLHTKADIWRKNLGDNLGIWGKMKKEERF